MLVKNVWLPPDLPKKQARPWVAIFLSLVWLSFGGLPGLAQVWPAQTLPGKITPTFSQPAFSPEKETPPLETPVISRLALSKLLLGWFEIDLEEPLNRSQVSEFSVFTDVETTDPDYAVLDTVRRYFLMFPDRNGAFNPQRPATQLDAWLAIAKVVFPKNTISDETTRQVMAPLLAASGSGGKQIPFYHQRRIARLFMGGILSPITDVPLRPNAPLTQADIDRLVSNLKSSQIVLKAQQKQDDLNVLPPVLVPGGIRFTLTPSQAIGLDKLLVGNEFDFITTQAITLPGGQVIPQGSVARGTVMDAPTLGSKGSLYQLGFTQVRSPRDGQRFELSGQATVDLNQAKAHNDYLITGDSLVFVSQITALHAPSSRP